MKILLFRFVFIIFCLIISYLLFIIFLYPIFTASELIIPYGIHPFDICSKHPVFWYYFKIIYIITYFLSTFIISNVIYSMFFKNLSFVKKNHNALPKTDELNLSIGKNLENSSLIFLPSKSLYQNILITGTIGSGKTSSAMYPFTEQLLKYNSLSYSQKLGMLILDVKGNFYKQVLLYAKKYFRQEDIILIEVGGKYTYNPLDKPNLKSSVLADRLKTVLTLFSTNNSDSYWLDKVAQVLTECIKLCRLYNNGYVTFTELHKLISFPQYYLEKVEYLRILFQKSIFTKQQCFDLLSALDFFETEFKNLDSRVLSIIQSEITRITSVFTSDYEIQNTFCPSKENISFHGFKEVLMEGKIVILNMDISQYKTLAKILATYLKLDFQTEVLLQLSSSSCPRPSVFICDEFHEFITSTDSDFFAQSREAKCINIVATQSYSSLLNTLKDNTVLQVILQNLVNKLWFRTDDIFTIENIQKQLGKEEKKFLSKSITESAKETNYNYITRTLNSKNSNISESINTYTHLDYIFDSNFFTSSLETFQCLAFLSDGNKILKPCKLSLTPYFKLQ